MIDLLIDLLIGLLIGLLIDLLIDLLIGLFSGWLQRDRSALFLGVSERLLVGSVLRYLNEYCELQSKCPELSIENAEIMENCP